MNTMSTKNKILIVDDDSAQRMLLRMNLEQENYSVIEAENGAEALDILFSNSAIRLVITDLDMPVLDGFGFISKVRADAVSYCYIIVLTSSFGKESLLKALSLGADDYLTKPVYPEELRLRLRGGERLLRLENQEELILAMAKLAEYRSSETGFHLERVEQYVRLISHDIAENNPELGVSKSMAEEIARVSPLHDIGKVAIPDHILHKPGKLTDDEFELMKQHPVYGGQLLKDMYDKTASPYLRLAYEVTMFHHEKYNGMGYPCGMQGDDIPIAARIMAIADIYDAMTSKRCYKDPVSHDKAKAIIISEKGRHLDPVVVDSFLRNEDIWLTVKARFQD